MDVIFYSTFLTDKMSNKSWFQSNCHVYLSVLYAYAFGSQQLIKSNSYLLLNNINNDKAKKHLADELIHNIILILSTSSFFLLICRSMKRICITTWSSMKEFYYLETILLMPLIMTIVMVQQVNGCNSFYLIQYFIFIYSNL